MDSEGYSHVTPSVESQLEYWTNTLGGASEALQFPNDHPRISLGSATAGLLPIQLSSELTQGLRALSERQGVSLSSTLLAGWAIMLARWCGQDDVLFSTRIQNSTFALGADPGLAVGFVFILRVQLQSDQTVAEVLKKTMNAVRCAYANPSVSIQQVLRHLDAVQGYAPPLRIMMELAREVCVAGEVTTAPEIEVSVDGPASRSSEESLPEAPAVDLALSLVEGSATLTGSLGYSSDVLDRDTILGFVESWQVLLWGMLNHLQRPISELPLLTDSQRLKIVSELNPTTTAYPGHPLIHELFEEQAKRSPEVVALVHEQRTITYGDLNRRANQLARYLRARGVARDDLVAVCMERSIEMVTAALGVLKAGGAYVPMDPAYPLHRLTHMLQDAAPQIVLVQEQLRGILPLSLPGLGDIQVVPLDANCTSISGFDGTDLPRFDLATNDRNLAFVIYTSGSTGLPKGAMNEHRGMVNRIRAQEHIEALSDTDICSQKTSISFVDSVFEIFGALCRGSPIVIISASSVINHGKMTALIAEHGITQLTTVPSLARSILDTPESVRRLSGLRNWTLSGEEVRPDLLIGLQQQLPKCEFIILYGASEVSSDAAFYKSRSFEGHRVPVGRPVPNTRAYVLGPNLQPVPIGMIGEIYIGGVGVGRGYLNRPELTAERFVSDLFSSDPGARLYRTGDLGRWRPDGLLECLGRNDHQVKIRGFRIELGEIEAQLIRHARVKEAIVVAQDSSSGEKHLVAYVTARDASDIQVEELRRHLQTTLPDYMVPAAFVTLERSPRTPNGKLDRRSLPMPGRGAYATETYKAPQGKREQIVARIWQALLNVEKVGRHDNFFELGGHSLLIVPVLEQLRLARFSADMSSLYAHPVLSDLASAIIEQSQPQVGVPENAIPPRCDWITPQMLPLVKLEPEHIERIARAVPGGTPNIQDIYPLSPLQEGILFHHLLDQESGDTYILTMLLRLASGRAFEQWAGALRKVVERHDALRTAIFWEQLDRPVQVVQRQAILPIEEIVLDPNVDVIEQFRDRMRPRWQRLDLRRAPILQLQVASDVHTGQRYVLLRTHHIVCDNASLDLMVTEVAACLKGRGAELADPVAFRTHVAQALEIREGHDAEAFFREKLADVDEPTAPFGLMDVHGSAERVDSSFEQLDAVLGDRLRARARLLGVSPATLFHAAWAVVVSRTSGRDDVIFGTVLLGRLHAKAAASQSVGMFINTLPLRISFSGLSVMQLIQATQQELAQLLIHEQASLSVAQRCSAVRGSAPLFTALLNYRHGAPISQAQQLSEWGIDVLASEEFTNYPIVLSVDDLGERFTLTAQTDRRLNPQRINRYLSMSLQSLLDACETNPETPALTLQVLTPQERSQILDTFNATHVGRPQTMSLHEIFEDQVSRTPTRTAVIYGQQSLTYCELNRRAGQLADYLIRQGVGTDELVGLCLDRSVEMIVGVFGVLKAGGAYVPLDPTYPTDRLAYILRDANPSIVLTQERLRSVLPDADIQIVALDSDWKSMVESAEPAHHLNSFHPKGKDLAYVIYTSGSTGQPKGVMVEHESVVNLWRGLKSIFHSKEVEHRRLAVNASLNFDASVQQLVQLLSGHTLILVPQLVRIDVPALLAFLHEDEIDAIDCTPTQLKTWIAAGVLGNSGRLRTVLVGGEPIDAELWTTLSNSPSIEFYNVYGPTETTVDATSTRIAHYPGGVHIGRPMESRRIYILDHHLHPVPVGVAGQIYIGGVGVARGYLNRPELTALQFVADPFSAGEHRRMYRSGDVGRWRSDGTIEYVGRNDQQVKIRGYRVELGEIEANIALHPQVEEVVVLVRENVDGNPQLVAYIIPKGQDAGSGLSAHILRKYLGDRLPGFMVPAVFVLLDEFPRTLSGKLDRRALPVPESRACVNRDHEPPEGAAEQELAQLWRALLPVKEVSRDDNFFELGGHSLLATQLMIRIRSQLGVELPLKLLFEFPTLRQLAAHVDQAQHRGLLETVAEGGRDIEQLLATVATLSDASAQDWAQKIIAGAKHDAQSDLG